MPSPRGRGRILAAFLSVNVAAAIAACGYCCGPVGLTVTGWAATGDAVTMCARLRYIYAAHGHLSGIRCPIFHIHIHGVGGGL